MLAKHARELGRVAVFDDAFDRQRDSFLGLFVFGNLDLFKLGCLGNSGRHGQRDQRDEQLVHGGDLLVTSLHRSSQVCMLT
jgi:hypothetical protein